MIVTSKTSIAKIPELIGQLAVDKLLVASDETTEKKYYNVSAHINNADVHFSKDDRETLEKLVVDLNDHIGEDGLHLTSNEKGVVEKLVEGKIEGSLTIGNKGEEEASLIISNDILNVSITPDGLNTAGSINAGSINAGDIITNSIVFGETEIIGKDDNGEAVLKSVKIKDPEIIGEVKIESLTVEDDITISEKSLNGIIDEFKGDISDLKGAVGYHDSQIDKLENDAAEHEEQINTIYNALALGENSVHIIGKNHTSSTITDKDYTDIAKTFSNGATIVVDLDNAISDKTLSVTKLVKAIANKISSAGTQDGQLCATAAILIYNGDLEKNEVYGQNLDLTIRLYVYSSGGELKYPPTDTECNVKKLTITAYSQDCTNGNIIFFVTI